MRKETRTIMLAFIKGKAAKAHRTHTDGEAVWLHHNKIAWRNPDGSVSMTLAGWGSVTTRERLNGLCELLFGQRPWHQERHVQRYDGEPIGVHEIRTWHSLASMAA